MPFTDLPEGRTHYFGDGHNHPKPQEKSMNELQKTILNQMIDNKKKTIVPPFNARITCLSIDCPERKSLCCGAGSTNCRLELLKWIEKTIEEKKKQKKSEKCVECGGSGMITDCIGGLDWAYKDGYNRAIEDIQLFLHGFRDQNQKE